jgi:FAD/FMN-containing dehydrogenase/Fe-S oxidoreductase
MTSNRDINLFLEKLSSLVEGEVLNDPYNLGIYSTDASIYQIKPMAIALPKSDSDLYSIVRTAREFQVPILARGAATSLAGQTVGNALVVDFSKYLDKILEINAPERWVRVQPGVVLDELNATLKAYGLQFAPDPATSSRANLGGMIANNSSGTKSIVYGKTSDHVLALKLLLSDGSILETKPLSLQDFVEKGKSETREGEIYRNFQTIIDKNRSEIRSRFPRVMRRVSGYQLDAFIDTSTMDLGQIILGSEGTLALIVEATLKLLPLPKYKSVCVVHFNSFMDGIRAVESTLRFNPVAVEILNDQVLNYSKKNLETRAHSGFIEGEPEAVLIVEFYGDSEQEIRDRSDQMVTFLKQQGFGYAFPYFREGKDYRDVWALRKKGLGLLMGEPQAKRPVAFIEDAALPIPFLPEYIEKVLGICKKYHTDAAAYAHASVGVIHVRPLLDLTRKEDIELLKKISQEAFNLVVHYGGSWSGEHGDGLSRGQYIEQFYGPDIYRAFREVKTLFDPDNLMNPGKIIDAPPLDQNLRYGIDYKDAPVKTFYHYRNQKDFHTAVHQCSGIGVCRKTQSGTMCPSYMVTRDEIHTTRGRANALRLAMSGQLGDAGLADRGLKDVLDLCVSCKACKAECPSSVDMARLKSEVLQMYYDSSGIPGRDKMVRSSAEMARRFSGPWAPLINKIQRTGIAKATVKRLFQFDTRRKLPEYTSQTLASWYRKRKNLHRNDRKQVILLADTYVNYHQPQIGKAAIRLLESMGFYVLLAEIGCCQRPRISHGFLRLAKKDGFSAMQKLDKLGAGDTPVVVCEPGCASALTDDLPDLVDDAELGARIQSRVMLLEEFIVQHFDMGPATVDLSGKKFLLHGHCHQKALFGTEPILKIITSLGGEILEVDSGCCGMAGSFGYETEHYDISKAMAERTLIPAIKATSEDTILIANGFSCRHQIEDLTDRKVYHWVDAIYK